MKTVDPKTAEGNLDADNIAVDGRHGDEDFWMFQRSRCAESEFLTGYSFVDEDSLLFDATFI